MTPLLSGALAVADELPAEPLRWWRAYVEHVALPVLDAYLTHGVVLEPHLQNVLVGVDAAGLPVEAIFRDMEGTKLVAGRHDLSGVPERVAEALTYDPAGGWDRVVYCLMVNHLAEIAASLAGPGPMRELWAAARGAGRVRRLDGMAAAAVGPAGRGTAARQGQPLGPVVTLGRPRGRIRAGGQPLAVLS